MASFYSTIWWLLLTIYVTRAVSPAIPKPGHKARIADRPLSEKSHFDEEHNVEFDHDAFLGSEEAKKFDEITPSESKERLGNLFLKIDKNGDGLVTEDDMRDWLKFVQKTNVLTETEQDWKDINPTAKEFISWPEYERHSYGISDGSDSDDVKTRDKRRWEQADVDGNNLLNLEEFNSFLHPEQSEQMKDLVIQETLEEVDLNSDGYISLDEYMSDAVGDDNEDEEDDSWIKEEEEEFHSELDRNGDGTLDREEISLWVLPEDSDHIDEEIKHLFSEADHNKDGFLDADEVVGNYELFVGSQVTDYGDMFKKDEL